MSTVFLVSLGLGSFEISVIILTTLGFFIMFGISSAKGGYQDLIKTTLDNDELRRKNRKS